MESNAAEPFGFAMGSRIPEPTTWRLSPQQACCSSALYVDRKLQAACDLGAKIFPFLALTAISRYGRKPVLPILTRIPLAWLDTTQSACYRLEAGRHFGAVVSVHSVAELLTGEGH